MTYVNAEKMKISIPFAKAYYPLPRRETLEKAFSEVVTDYFAKAYAGIPFEARGLILTGDSRTGKTREILAVIEKFRGEEAALPDGQPARFVHCKLSGMINWKELGIRALDSLGYPLNGQRTQSYIWAKVVEQAKLQGVIGIHFDECQHMFSPTAMATNMRVLEGFKALLKDSRWPLSLILSGVPELNSYVRPYDQLKELLDPVHFINISLPDDIDELNNLAFAFADLAVIDFEPLSSTDFYTRLTFACGRRWGLVIELIILALTNCKMDGRGKIEIKDFEDAFTQRSGMPPGFTPFTVDDYEDAFDPAKLAEMLKRED